ncbi:hypothetical protein Sjap_004993 [Stephania japonica]|uniref:MINDY deubiquitinase domain-containing protein n=1 Tax=Stephania japonica TaxID=461633 RepID=A0AAP0PKQ6_9MAGN
MEIGSAVAAEEEDQPRRNEEKLEEKSEEKNEEEERLYKTKVVQFLGRKTPIILQNDNGPCPLLAICNSDSLFLLIVRNVLLLKNCLNLSLDASEVSLQKLLSLVAERLIDSNSNTENVDAGFLENQQQNIADAIDLLHRLATGIDVNIKFRRIDDFEFTRECAIFDLLDIPLYHGWIVDPQDYNTADAIGSKSYNTLMGELVALETRNPERENESTEDDGVDFAAATTAALGVPSPCLSRGMSFDDSPHSVSSDHRVRKGDREEEEELLRVLKLTETERTNSLEESLIDEKYNNDLSSCKAESQENKIYESGGPADVSGYEHRDKQQVQHSEHLVLPDSSPLTSYRNDRSSVETSCGEVDHFDHLSIEETKQTRNVPFVQNQSETLPSIVEDSSISCNDHIQKLVADQEEKIPCPQGMPSGDHERAMNQSSCDAVVSVPSTSKSHPDLLDDMTQLVDPPKCDSSSLDGSEPLYEGEECILDPGRDIYENREPMYEGEIILAEQADKGAEDTSDTHPKDDITPQKGELIKNFLKSNASQLTVYGYSRSSCYLIEGLKERELCVFFRNNHFSTMFKFSGELYLLATDQGYINQPDLVWEKLNEVNGDTVFMTGNFTKFMIEHQSSDKWDEQNVVASTADYLASIDKSTPGGSTMNSDLQLAIQLQQQEFEYQPKRHNNSQQASVSGSSRLVTGPQLANPIFMLDSTFWVMMLDDLKVDN